MQKHGSGLGKPFRIPSSVATSISVPARHGSDPSQRAPPATTSRANSYNGVGNGNNAPSAPSTTNNHNNNSRGPSRSITPRIVSGGMHNDDEWSQEGGGDFGDGGHGAAAAAAVVAEREPTPDFDELLGIPSLKDKARSRNPITTPQLRSDDAERSWKEGNKHQDRINGLDDEEDRRKKEQAEKIEARKRNQKEKDDARYRDKASAAMAEAKAASTATFYAPPAGKMSDIKINKDKKKNNPEVTEDTSSPPRPKRKNGNKNPFAAKSKRRDSTPPNISSPEEEESDDDLRHTQSSAMKKSLEEKKNKVARTATKDKGKGKATETVIDISSPDKRKSSRLNDDDSPRATKKARAASQLGTNDLPLPDSSTSRSTRTKRATYAELSDSDEDGSPKRGSKGKSKASPIKKVDLDKLIEKERKKDEKVENRERIKRNKARQKRRDKGEESNVSEDEDEEEDVLDDDDLEELQEDLFRSQEEREMSGTPDSWADLEVNGPDPSTLCPFCSLVLPTSPSARLSQLKTYLLARPNIKKNPSTKNPKGMRLPVVETASFCRLHEEESIVIPNGKEKGWPTSIDWEGLPDRIGELVVPLSAIVMGREKSSFFEQAKEEWDTKGGRKMKNILSEFGSFDVEQPGYYGVRGHELMIKTLTDLFTVQTPILSSSSASPLDIPAYLRRVLLPECAILLIASDLSQSVEDARQTLIDSRAYGRAMFRSTEEEEEFAREEERREEKEEERRRKEKKEREKEKRKEKRGGAAGGVGGAGGKEKSVKEQEKEIRERAVKKAKMQGMTNQLSSSGDEMEAPKRRKPAAAAATTTTARRKPAALVQKEQQAAAASSSAPPLPPPSQQPSSKRSVKPMSSSHPWTNNMRDSLEEAEDDDDDGPLPPTNATTTTQIDDSDDFFFNRHQSSHTTNHAASSSATAAAAPKRRVPAKAKPLAGTTSMVVEETERESSPVEVVVRPGVGQEEGDDGPSPPKRRRPNQAREVKGKKGTVIDVETSDEGEAMDEDSE